MHKKLKTNRANFKGSTMTTENQSTGLLPLTSVFLADVERETQRAREKFPSNQHKLAALTEEVGEVANAFLENQYGNKPAIDVWKECVQAAAMALRCAVEGDHSFDYQPPSFAAALSQQQAPKPDAVKEMALEALRKTQAWLKKLPSHDVDENVYLTNEAALKAAQSGVGQ
jgi:hypothetical protein